MEKMTAILALMAKDKGGPELEFQGMLWSAMGANFATRAPLQLHNYPRFRKNEVIGFRMAPTT